MFEITLNKINTDLNQTRVVIPDNITTIGSYILSANSIEEIIIPNSVREIESSAFSNSKLTSIEIPNSVKKIGTNAFFKCTKLESVKLHSNLKKININCFHSNEKLNNVIIPASICKIEMQAFMNCLNLTHLVFKGKNCDIHEKVFDNTPYESIYNKCNHIWEVKHFKFIFPKIKDTSVFGKIIIDKYKITQNKIFIKFLSDINKDRENIIKYVANGIFTLEDIFPILAKDEYVEFKGFKNGQNYGI